MTILIEGSMTGTASPRLGAASMQFGNVPTIIFEDSSDSKLEQEYNLTIFGKVSKDGPGRTCYNVHASLR